MIDVEHTHLYIDMLHVWIIKNVSRIRSVKLNQISFTYQRYWGEVEAP